MQGRQHGRGGGKGGRAYGGCGCGCVEGILMAGEGGGGERRGRVGRCLARTHAAGHVQAPWHIHESTALHLVLKVRASFTRPPNPHGTLVIHPKDACKLSRPSPTPLFPIPIPVAIDIQDPKPPSPYPNPFCKPPNHRKKRSQISKRRFSSNMHACMPKAHVSEARNPQKNRCPLSRNIPPLAK